MKTITSSGARTRMLALVAGASVACNGLFGITDGAYVPADAGTDASIAANQDGDSGSADDRVGFDETGVTDGHPDGDARDGGAAPVCDPSCPTGCKNNECLVTLVSGIVNPDSLAVDGTRVYYTSWTTYYAATSRGRLDSVSAADGGLPMALDQDDGVFSVVSDPPNIAWVNYSDAGVVSLISAPGAGGPRSTLTLGPNRPAMALAASGGKLYWTFYSITGTASPGLYWSPEDADGGSFAINSIVFQAGYPSFDVLAINKTKVFFITGTALMKDALTGGAGATIPANGVAWCVAADEQNVYWVDDQGVEKEAADADPGAVPEILLPLPPPERRGSCILVADDSVSPTVLYLAKVMPVGNTMEYAIRRLSSTGDAGATTLVTTSDVFTGLAVDDTSVYWTASPQIGITPPEAGVGSVMKLTPK